MRKAKNIINTSFFVYIFFKGHKDTYFYFKSLHTKVCIFMLTVNY